MISFVKGKFNFLAAFCIVALIFITVALMSTHYLYKKLKKYKTEFLRHKKDNIILGFMIGLTLTLGVFITFGRPLKPEGQPQPIITPKVSQETLFTSMQVDRSFGIGRLSLDGWWNFDRIDFFKSLDDSFLHTKNAEILIKSHPADAEFRISPDATVSLGADLDTSLPG